MAHEGLFTFFVFLTALAVLMQAIVLYAMFRAVSRIFTAVARIDASVRDHLNPVLDSIHGITTEARAPVNNILTNLAEITKMFRDRAASADAVAAEMLERARAEIIKVDELLTGVLARMERTADAVERGVLVPVREISAVVAGIRRGLAYFFGRGRQQAKARAPQEEELFI